QQSGEKSGEKNAELVGGQGHCLAFLSLAIESSNRANKSFASGVPPTVYGRATNGIPVRSASHCVALGSLYMERVMKSAGSAFSRVTSSARCPALGGTPGFGSTFITSTIPSQCSR